MAIIKRKKGLIEYLPLLLCVEGMVVSWVDQTGERDDNGGLVKRDA